MASTGCSRIKKEIMQKQMSHFTDNKNTLEFIQVLEDELLEDLKCRNSVIIITKGKGGGTWMHPYLFVKFSMCLNPRFEIKVIKFLYDKLIEFKHTAGDHYKILLGAIKRFGNVDYGIIDNDYRKQFYLWKGWRAKRKIILNRDEWLCVKCFEEDVLTQATEVDHIEDLKDRPDLCLVENNLQSLCISQHSKKTYHSNYYNGGESRLGNPYYKTELRPPK